MTRQDSSSVRRFPHMTMLESFSANPAPSSWNGGSQRRGGMLLLWCFLSGTAVLTLAVSPTVATMELQNVLFMHSKGLPPSIHKQTKCLPCNRTHNLVNLVNPFARLTGSQKERERERKTYLGLKNGQRSHFFSLLHLNDLWVIGRGRMTFLGPMGRDQMKLDPRGMVD